MGKESRSQATAYHEAGHAVACFMYDIKLHSISIRPDEDSHGRVNHNNPLFRISDNAGDLSASQRQRIERCVVIALAGNVAQRRFNPRSVRSHHAQNDFNKAADVLSHLSGSDKELQAYMNLLLIRAENLLMRMWPSVTALASSLLKESALSGEQATAIIRGPWKR